MAKYTLWEAVNLALTASTKALTEVRQLAKTPPPPGKDGLGFDDMEEEMAADGRTVVRRYRRGSQVKEFTHRLSIPIYQGTYRNGMKYAKADMVTDGGSLWIAERDTNDKPETTDAWKLCAKRGRDGRPSRDNGNG